MTYTERRTVVGYDGSGPAQAALDWAATDAARRGSELLVLHVAQWGLSEQSTAAGLRRIGPLEDSSRELLTEALARVRTLAPDLPVTLETVLAGISRSLVEASGNAEMIVLGVPEGLGSTTAAVVARAHCPVVVVGPGTTTGADLPVTVGYDGSASSQRALCFAAERARLREVELVVVVAFASLATLERSGVPAFGANAVHDAQLLGEVALDRVRRSFPGVRVRYELFEGAALPALADASRGCGLVVVGNRGSGPEASVGNGLITQSHSPLAVIH